MSQAKLDKKIEREANRPIAAAHDMPYMTSSGRDEPSLEAASEPVAAVSLHALDSSPANSKIVVTEEGAILATPEFEIRLPDGDAAHKLPTGARIQKKAEGIYLSLQMSPAEDHPILVTATAREAIEQFVPHFHES